MPRACRSEFVANLHLEPITMAPKRRLKLPLQPVPKRVRWGHVAQTLTPWLACLAFWVLVFA